MPDIAELLAARNKIQRQLCRHQKRGEELQKTLDAAIHELQSSCPHENQRHDSQYHSGGYDYCASTSHTVTCTLCEKVLKSWDEDHHGRFG